MTMQQKKIAVGIGGLTLLLVAVLGISTWLGDADDAERGDPIPSILYLAPATTYASNLYAYDPQRDTTQQLTDTEFGVLDYAISPDGEQIAYTQANGDGTSDIWLLDVASGDQRPLTNCVEAICLAPAWHPDGTKIAFEREEADHGGTVEPARRVWVVEVATAQAALLFEDTSIVGHSPQYAPDGSRLAIYSENLQAILILNLAENGRVAIHSEQGVVGAFSPDGNRLIYPVLIRGATGQNFYTHLEMVDLRSEEITPITGDPEIAVSDQMAAWHPDGQRIAIARRDFNRADTPNAQVYLLDLETGDLRDLVIDPAYIQSSLGWGEDGEWLVMHRFNTVQPNATPEIWLYEMANGDMQLIAENAFLPTVLP